MTAPDPARRAVLAAGAAALARPAWSAAAVPAAPRVVCLGDSIIAAGNMGGDPAGKGVQSSARGEANLAQAIDPRFRLDTWPDGRRTEGQVPPYFWGANQGRGGEPSGGALARLPQAMTLAPDVLVVATGTNDLQDPARVVANLDAICEGARRARPATVVVLATVRPVVRGAPTAGPRPLDKLQAANAGIRAIAKRRPSVVLWDAYAALAQSDGWGAAGDFEDGLHVSPAGALKSGALAATSLSKAMAQVVPAGDVFAPLFAHDLAAGLGGGTQAAVGERVSGQVRSGMALASPPNGRSLTGAVVAGPSGPVQSVRVSPGGETAGTRAPGARAFVFRPAAVALPTPGGAGRWVRMVAQVAYDDWPGWLCPYASLADRTDPATHAIGLSGGLDHWVAGARTMWVATPAILLPTSSAGVVPALAITYRSDAPGSGTVRILRWGVGVTPDPRPG